MVTVRDTFCFSVRVRVIFKVWLIVRWEYR